MSRKGIRPMVFVVIRRGDDVLVWVGHDEYSDRQIMRMLDHEEIDVTWRPTAPGAAPEQLYPPGIATLLDETAVVPTYVPAERE